MKICFACHKSFQSTDWCCTYCLKQPEIINGYWSFIDKKKIELATSFPIEEFANLAKLEEQNFWFRARNQLIFWALQKYFPSTENFLEIGCGTGFVSSGIKKYFPNLAISASDLYDTALCFATARMESVQFLRMDAMQIPFVEEFDVVGCFDVLEHIEEDCIALSEIYRAVNRGGGIILTVPQHPFLWSAQDTFAHHVRRYTAKELKTKVREAGFKIIKCISFVSLLFPMLVAVRLFKKNARKQADPLAEFKLPRLPNFILEEILLIERQFIRLGMNLPFGGSLLLIGKKQANA